MKKVRIISLSILLLLCVSVVAYGVYAASTVSFTTSGTIGFITNNVDADIVCYTKVEDNARVQSNSYSLTGSTESNSWSVPSLSFVTNTPGYDPAEDATFKVELQFDITNNGSRTIYAFFTNNLENIIYSFSDGDTLLTSVSSKDVDVTFSNRTPIPSLSTSTLKVTFTIPQKNNAFTRNEVVTFNYKLNLDRFNREALPDEYQKVEYLESTGTQYIDTGLSLPSGYVLNGDFNVTDTRSDLPIFGVQELSGEVYYRSFGPWATENSGGKYKLGYGAGGAIRTASADYDRNKRYNFEVSTVIGNNLLKVDGETVATSQVVETLTNLRSAENLYLFGINNKNGDGIYSAVKVSCKVYSGLKIYDENNLLVRYFITCYRKADNVFGLYDTVDGVFYTNEGTGAFVSGSISSLPVEYQQVEYIKSTGAQYIDTGYVINNEKATIEFESKLPASIHGLSFFGSNNSNYDLVPYHSDSYGTRVFSHLVGTTSGTLNVAYSEGINDVVYTLNNGTLTCNINGLSSSTTYTGSIISGYSFYIFGKNNHGDSDERASGYTLYGLKLYDNDVLVRDLVPCYRKSDNVIGLYDKTSTGLNIWDEAWESGRLSTTGEIEGGSNQIRSKNYIPVLSSTKYYFKTTNTNGLVVYYYDENNTFISREVNVANQELTTPVNCCYIKFYTYNDYGSTYNYDMCVNLSNSARNGTYESHAFYTNAGTGSFTRGMATELPVEYQGVEYIQSSGTQYINTGVIPTENTKVKGNFVLTEAQNGVSVFGCFNTAESKFNLLVTTTLFNKITGNLYINSNSLSPSVAPAINTNYNFEISLPNYVINNSSYASDSYSYTSSTSSLYIFSRNTGNSADQFTKMKLYVFDIYDNGALVREYVPCYRKSDNVVGLYDLVNGVFYTNAGTGTFTKGSNVG